MDSGSSPWTPAMTSNQQSLEGGRYSKGAPATVVPKRKKGKLWVPWLAKGLNPCAAEGYVNEVGILIQEIATHAKR